MQSVPAVGHQVAACGQVVVVFTGHWVATCGQTVWTFGHSVGVTTCGQTVAVIGHWVWTDGQRVGCCGE